MSLDFDSQSGHLAQYVEEFGFECISMTKNHLWTFKNVKFLKSTSIYYGHTMGMNHVIKINNK